MRILIQALTAAQGGSVTMLRDVVAAWPDDDELLIACWRPDAAAVLESSGARVAVVRAHSTPAALAKLFARGSIASRFEPNVVWSQAVLIRTEAPQALHLRDIGLFTRAHRSSPREVVRRARASRDVRNAELTIVNSKAMRDAVRHRVPGLSPDLLAIVPNGLDLTALRTVPRQPWLIGETLRVLLPQADHPHKRNWLAADALRALVDADPARFGSVELIVTGSGDYRDLRQRLRGQDHRVHAIFTGHASRPQMVAHYRDCHVVLLTSAAESFSNPAVEAAAAGRPLVAPRLDALLETGGPMATLVASDTVAEYAAALIRAVGNRDSEILRNQARAHAERFQANHVASRLRSVLSGISGRRPPTRSVPA